MTGVKRSGKMSPYGGDSHVEREGTEEANGCGAQSLLLVAHIATSRVVAGHHPPAVMYSLTSACICS